MKKKINDKLTLYFSNRFPFIKSTLSKKKNIVVIGIGGNMGNVKMNFNKLIMCFANDTRFNILKCSPILKNPPFGFLDQDDFFNAVIVLKTDLFPKEALRAFQRYEQRFKRKRSFKDAPRTLDIDIIFFNNMKINTKELTVPHAGYKERESVLIPLKFVQA